MALPGLRQLAGYRSEISGLVPGWIASLAGWLEAGAAFLFDYGFSRAEYYRAERSAGTLRCFYRHRAHDDPFLWPGLQDITSWVDFTLVAESATAAGFALGGYTTQAHFLLASGINERFEAVAATNFGDQVTIAQNMRRLLLPGEMGETVKCIALLRNYDEMPDGMLGRDMRSSL
jgi:SAM-dependent MidA family methyltransferase